MEEFCPVFLRKKYYIIVQLWTLWIVPCFISPYIKLKTTSGVAFVVAMILWLWQWTVRVCAYFCFRDEWFTKINVKHSMIVVVATVKDEIMCYWKMKLCATTWFHGCLWCFVLCILAIQLRLCLLGRCLCCVYVVQTRFKETLFNVVLMLNGGLTSTFNLPRR